MLAGFIKYSPTWKAVAVSVTGKSLIFSESVAKLLGRDSYVSFWIDYKSKRIAIQKENEKDKDALHVFTGKYQSNYVRVSNIVVMSAIKRLMPHWELDKKVYKAKGTFDETNTAVIFDFLNAQEREKHGRNRTRQD
jgi:hypothetical protein